MRVLWVRRVTWNVHHSKPAAFNFGLHVPVPNVAFAERRTPFRKKDECIGAPARLVSPFPKISLQAFGERRFPVAPVRLWALQHPFINTFRDLGSGFLYSAHLSAKISPGRMPARIANFATRRSRIGRHANSCSSLRT